MKKILEIFLKSLIFLVLAWALFTSLSSRFSLSGIRSYVVLTGSMRPTLGVDSLIYVFANKMYNVGDIITFHKGKIDITHRIIAVRSIGNTTLYQTKGDANTSEDQGNVYSYEVVGKVVFFIPEIGRFVLFIKTLPGFLLVLVLPTFIFVAYEIKFFKEEWEKEIEKKLMKKLKTVEKEIEGVIEKV